MRAVSVAAAVVVLLLTAARAAEPELPLRVSARTDMVVVDNRQPEGVHVRVEVRRYSTADEVAAIRAAVEDRSGRALAKLLAKADLGTVSLSPGVTNTIGCATRVEAPFGEVIRIMTSQPFVRPRAGGDYVGYVEIRLPSDASAPHGTIVPAAIVRFDDKDQPYPDDAPLNLGAGELTNVRRDTRR